MDNTAISATEQHLEQFERFEKEAKQPAWAFLLHRAGLARFAEHGFPTLQEEDWRFTNVAPIVRLPFRPVFQRQGQELSQADVKRFVFSELPGPRLVFLDGHFAPGLSTNLTAGEATITSLAAGLAQSSETMQRYLSRQPAADEDPFSSLNTAFFQDGAFVHVPAGCRVAQPIHILFISTAAETGATSNPRNLLVLERGSAATVLESYVSLADGAYFTNAVTDMLVEEGAVLEHCKFQDESASAYHMAGIRARLGRGSRLFAHSLALGAKLSRNNIRTTLDGQGVECVLNGLYLTRNEQLADHHMVVEHAQPNCTSHEYYNGILDGRSKGVFHGRILVRQPAQKTDAKQTNKNLLLSENATVDTKPQLEIYADDVKCTHGATVGQLNDESIFYLRARGIGASTARRMLIHAFAGEIIERIRYREARELLDQVVWHRLEANPHVGVETGGSSAAKN